MHEAAAIGQFERRLVELGCPAVRLREKVRELAEHYGDLKEAALEEGLTEGEAEARAEAQLGDSVLLAEYTVAAVRRASWWGRHPVLGFGLLPPLAFIPAWVICSAALVGTCWLLGRMFGSAYQIDEGAARAMTVNPDAFRNFVAPANEALMLVAILLSAVLFCWLARRAAVGMKWIWTACLICSLSSLVTYPMIGPGFIGIGFALPSSNWFHAVLPISVALVAFIRQRRTQNRLASIPEEKRLNARQKAAGGIFSKQSIYRMPTYWAMAVIAAAVLAIVIFVEVMSAQDKAEHLDLRSRVWPAERAATLRQLGARQSAASESINPIMIDLKALVNASLLASVDGPANVKDNNLAELPSGVHTFAGVPFDVEGRLQLMGRNLIESGKRFPVIVKHIPISRQCARLHLLHGASAVRTLDKKIARIVLHYADGSQAKIGIRAGQDVLDWWGPIYNTEAGEERQTTSPGTELAWAGGNPWIKQRAPEFSLRLYRSTFANPRPDLEISSIDYVSTLTDAAPFLVGLTID
jgi:hypothetical protein